MASEPDTKIKTPRPKNRRAGKADAKSAGGAAQAQAGSGQTSGAGAAPGIDWVDAMKSLWGTMLNPAQVEAGLHQFQQHWSGQMPGSPDRMPDVRIDPARLLALQNVYQQDLGGLWKQFLGGDPSAKPHDKRFTGEAWQGMHAYVATHYELNSKYLTALAEEIEADHKTKAKIRFAVQQMIDALAPSNFFATNPAAQQKLIESRGESLQAGLSNMLADLQKGRISMTDESAFEIGRNLATSVGAVVYQNELFQLIQYKPQTALVHERPLLLVPPCINKYYILDLQPENSFVRHALAEGHSVFLVSWCNPMAPQARLTWDDYIENGVIEAFDVTRAISAQEQINVLGFCVGGTMVSTALAVLAARGRQPAASITLLTALLDFSDTGILEVFIDENQVRQREQTIGGLTMQGGPGGPVGLMPARDLATSFSFLRPNDLVWNYVVNNYLMGESPPPFDLLYWNADSTNLPGPFFVWYLRNAYLENKLRQPGQAMVCGAPVDFGKITAPAFIYGSREDHIVPWPSAYASTQLLGGPTRFVLGASGHIAGVINPPAKKKRSYWTYDPLRGRFPVDQEVWFRAAVEHPGSWWPEWSRWLASHAGRLVAAPARAGNAAYPVLEAAPGSYVRVRA